MGVFELAGVAEADEEWNDAENAEAAVDQAPVRGYAPDRSGDKGEGNDAGAGDDSELEYPLVADWVDERSDEGDGDDEMRKREPVGAVGHEGVGPVGLHDAGVNPSKPGMKHRLTRGHGQRRYVEDPVEESSFVLEREGGHAADHKSHDEEDKPESYAADEAVWGSGRHAPV